MRAVLITDRPVEWYGATGQASARPACHERAAMSTGDANGVGHLPGVGGQADRDRGVAPDHRGVVSVQAASRRGGEDAVVAQGRGELGDESVLRARGIGVDRRHRSKGTPVVILDGRHR